MYVFGLGDAQEGMDYWEDEGEQKRCPACGHWNPVEYDGCVCEVCEEEY